jgi:hypothetical protein
LPGEPERIGKIMASALTDEQIKTLPMAVRNNRTGNRFSGLLARLVMPG